MVTPGVLLFDIIRTTSFDRFQYVLSRSFRMERALTKIIHFVYTQGVCFVSLSRLLSFVKFFLSNFKFFSGKYHASV